MLPLQSNNNKVYAANSVDYYFPFNKGSGPFTLASYICGAYEVKGAGGIQTTYNNIGYDLYCNNTAIRVSPSFKYVSMGNYLQVTFVCANTTSTSQNFTLGTGTDTDVDGNDAVPLSILYDNNGQYKGFVMQTGNVSYNVLCRNTYGATNVTRLWCGQYSGRFACYTGSEQVLGYSGDSGFAIAWDDTLQAGETKSYSYLIGYGVVNDPPTITLNATNDTYYEDDYINLSGSVSDIDEGDTVSVLYSFDNGTESYLAQNLARISTFNSNVLLPKLTAGMHTLSVYAMDDKGNVSTVIQRQFTYINAYNVTYDGCGGTNVPATQKKKHNVTLTLSNTIPTRTGYTFKGWNTASNGTGTAYAAGSNYTENRALNLFAMWSNNLYTLTVNPNGGNVAGQTTAFNLDPKLIYDGGNWCYIAAGTKVGYDFTGYFDSAVKGIQLYKVCNVHGACAIVNTSVWSGVEHSYYLYKRDGDLTIYAHYTPRNDTKYVINHYLMTVDGTAYELRDIDHKEGTSDKVITVSDYQKHYNGFTYAGGKGTDKASAEKPSQLDITTTISADGSRVINLYYTRNKYNLTVKPNGGTYDGKSSDSVFNMFYQATKVMNKPSKKDCAFLGWTLSGTNESSILNNVFKMGYSDASLTANWSELPKFVDVYSNVLYEGQTVTYNDLLKLVKATDKDYKNGTEPLSVTVDKIRYCDNSEVTPQSDFILDTASNKIGKLYITYTTVDIKPSLDGITDTSQAETITVTYTRECEIRYNDLPSLTTEPYIYTYTGDNTLTEDTIESFVKGYVTVNDKQDDVDLIPWWNATTTKADLRNSIEVVKVTDIQLDSAYVKDNADFAATVKGINSLKGIYSLKKTAPDAFNAITSYNVVFDVKDQWGKYTSGRLSNYAVGKGVTVSERDKTQTDEDRSILVICTKDSSYNNAYEGLRYVSSKYVNTVNANSYWGDYGKVELNSVLKKRDLVYADENITPTDSYVGTYTKKNGISINIQINDYTE